MDLGVENLKDAKIRFSFGNTLTRPVGYMKFIKDVFRKHKGGAVFCKCLKINGKQPQKVVKISKSAPDEITVELA